MHICGATYDLMQLATFVCMAVCVCLCGEFLALMYFLKQLLLLLNFVIICYVMIQYLMREQTNTHYKLGWNMGQNGKNYQVFQFEFENVSIEVEKYFTIKIFKRFIGKNCYRGGQFFGKQSKNHLIPLIVGLNYNCHVLQSRLTHTLKNLL